MRREIKYENFTWVDIKGPTNEDLKWLKENFNLHPLVLNELLPHLDYPKIENFGDYLFLVLFYPSFSPKNKTTVPLELDIIVSDHYIITNHYKDIPPLKYIFDQCNLYLEQKAVYAKNGPGELLHQIIKKLLLACFPKLTHIKNNIDDAEEAVYENKKYGKTVTQIALIQRDLIGFQKIIEPLGLVLDGLAKESQGLFDQKLIPYFHHLTDLYRQMENNASTRAKALSALDNANNSLLTTRTNEIIKILTIFSVVVFPMTFLTNFFGMNIETMPFLQESTKLLFILSAMVIATVAFLLYFTRKKWR